MEENNYIYTNHGDSVADLGFSPGGAPTPKVGVLIYYFCRKLHKNERIWTPGGGARPWRPPLDPPMGLTVEYFVWFYWTFRRRSRCTSCEVW